MAWFLAPGRPRDECPPHPSCRRVGSHVDMPQLAPAVGDEHQHVQRLERQCGDAQQVGGPEMVSMVAQECAPCLSWCGAWSSPAIAPNRAIANHDAQLEQLASDPLGAPQSVVARHGCDQLPHLGTEMRPSTTGARLPTPEEAPA